MRLKAIWLAILAAVSLFAGEPVRADERIAKIAKDYLETVATLVALDNNKQPLALGTGFFLDTAGSLVTAAHVVEGAAGSCRPEDLLLQHARSRLRRL